MQGGTGIIINSGNFEHSPSANLLAPNKAIVNSGNTNFPYTVGEPGYADALTVSEWAVPAMQWANGVGLIQGSDNNLMPKGNATRAQAAAILHRFCETVTGE